MSDAVKLLKIHHRKSLALAAAPSGTDAVVSALHAANVEMHLMISLLCTLAAAFYLHEAYAQAMKEIAHLTHKEKDAA